MKALVIIYFTFIDKCIGYVCTTFFIIVQFISVDLRDVKEVRYGNNSKEFDRYPDEFKKFDASKCFVIFYGNEFKLKTLSVVGKQVTIVIDIITYILKQT